ncbi:MAG TPA: hypothetical protein VF269_07300 [Rhodanobacteraceae bacterium]
MKTKFICLVAATGLLIGASGLATAATTIYQASPTSPTMFTPHALPVLVRVNRNGKVSYVAPAYPLRMQYRSLLVETLDHMITKPAHNSRGTPVASQFIMYLTTKTTKRKDGSYNLQFIYITANPVPFGAWYWGHYMGDNLALIEDGGRRPRSRCPLYYDGICFIPSCISVNPSCNSPDLPATNTDKKDSTKSAGTAQYAHAKEMVASTHSYRLYRVTDHAVGAVRRYAPNVSTAVYHDDNTPPPATWNTPSSQTEVIRVPVRPQVSTPASRGVYNLPGRN